MIPKIPIPETVEEPTPVINSQPIYYPLYLGDEWKGVYFNKK